MTTFLRYPKVASFIVLVAALSMMPACGPEEPGTEELSDLSSSFIEQPLDYAAPCDVLEYTVHIVNTGSATQAEATAELSSLLIYVPGSEWASDGDVQYDPDEGSVRLQGDIPADSEVLFGFHATVNGLAAGQSVLTEVSIYDILKDAEHKPGETTPVHPGIEYRWDECDCKASMHMDECDIACEPISHEKTDLDERGVLTGRSITKYEYDSLGRRITEETTNSDEEGAPVGRATTEYEYDGVGNRISEEMANFDKQGTPTGGSVTQYEYDPLNRLITRETTNLDEEGTPTGGATTEYEYDSLGNRISQETTNSGELAVETTSTFAEYEYDGQGRVTQVTETNFDENGVKTGSTVADYEYDAQGRITQVSVSNFDAQDVQTDGRLTDYEYDAQGRITQVSVSNFDAQDVQTDGRLTDYEYNAQGRITQVSVSNFDAQDVQTDGTLTDYEYDQQGRLAKVSVSYLDEQDIQTTATSTEYEYDGQGRIIKVTVSTFDESDTLTSRKVTEYKYDEQGKMTEVSSEISDPVGDLYGSGGVPASGPDWQDITEVDVARNGETLTFTLTVDDDFPDITDFSDGAIMILIDINGDGEVAPSEGPIDFYGGNFDYGVFIPSPGFGEPPIFIEDLRLQGAGAYDTTGAQYSIDGDKIEIEIVALDLIGDPEGSIGFVGAIRTGIMSGPITEDRIPNEGLAEIPDP